MKSKVSIVLAGLMLFAVVSLYAPAETPAALGDIVGRYYSVSDAWWGGLTYKDGYIYENTDNAAAIFKRDPNTGNLAVVGSITHTAARDIGLAWDEDNRCWWLCNPWGPRNVYRIEENGGGITQSFDANTNEYGIFYDPDDKVLYVTNNAKKALDVYRTNGTRIRQIAMPWDQSGIVRVGDKLWIGRHEMSGIYEFTLNGQMTGRSVTIPDRRFSGDMAFDGQYLWSRSNSVGKIVYIYKIDIGITPLPTATPTPLPTPAAVIESGDYNGDGTSDIGVYRPSSGLWAIRDVTRAYWGKAGGSDIPIPGDYNADGTSNIAAYRPSAGYWFIKDLTKVFWGKAGDIPVPGDYNGNGSSDIGVYRPSSGLWAIRGVSRAYWGKAGDVPVPGDYDGNGSAAIAAYRPSSGYWFIKDLTRAYWGKAGDIPAAADYNIDGTTDIGVFRPSTGLWVVRSLTRTYWGKEVDIPVPGLFHNPSSAQPSAIGAYRPSSGYWFIKDLTKVFWGKPGDVPVAGPPAIKR